MGNKQSTNRQKKAAVQTVENKEDEEIDDTKPITIIEEVEKEPKKSILVKTPNNNENIERRLQNIKEKRLRAKLAKEQNNIRFFQSNMGMESNVTKLPIVLKVIASQSEKIAITSENNGILASNQSVNVIINKNGSQVSQFKNSEATKKFDFQVEKSEEKSHEAIESYDENETIEETMEEFQKAIENELCDEKEEDSCNEADKKEESVDLSSINLGDNKEDGEDNGSNYSQPSSTSTHNSGSLSISGEDIARELDELARENDFDEPPRPPKRKKKLAASESKHEIYDYENFKQFGY